MLQYAYTDDDAVKIYQFIQDCNFKLKQMGADLNSFRDPELAEFYPKISSKPHRAFTWTRFLRSPRFIIPTGIVLLVAGYYTLTRDNKKNK